MRRKASVWWACIRAIKRPGQQRHKLLAVSVNVTGLQQQWVKVSALWTKIIATIFLGRTSGVTMLINRELSNRTYLNQINPTVIVLWRSNTLHQQDHRQEKHLTSLLLKMQLELMTPGMLVIPLIFVLRHCVLLRLCQLIYWFSIYTYALAQGMLSINRFHKCRATNPHSLWFSLGQ